MHLSQEFQIQFYDTIEKLVSKTKSSKFEQQTPKIHSGTVKRYLSEIQIHILALLKKHILQSRDHPIVLICELFQESFEKAYQTYTRPEVNESGVRDKAYAVQ